MIRPPLILVMGARGGIGRAVVRELVGRGGRVRASSRRPSDVEHADGVEVVAADVSDPDTLTAAFEGVSRAFVFAIHQGAHAVAAAAGEAGVEELVLLSSGSVLVPTSADNPITVEHRQVEEALTGSGGPILVPVRPLVLASNALAWAPQIKATGTVSLYQPDALTAPVHEADVAGVVVAALTGSTAHRGGAPSVGGLLTGPAQLSQRDQVAAVGRAIGRKIAVVEQTRAEATARLSRYVPRAEAEAIVMFLDDCAAGHSPATDTAHRVLGREPRDFESWAADHADDFR